MVERGKKQVSLLIILILIFLAVNYSFLDKKIEGFLIENEKVKVLRIIDGDTIVVENNTHVRLLGINTPEKGEFYHDEAMNFLSGLISNKTIRLEKVGDNKDKYGRLLRYIFLGNESVNIELVKNGFANYYFYSGKDMYSEELESAWEACIKNMKNLCEPSANVCRQCIEIENKNIINSCNFSCNITGWMIKGEGREKYYFNENIITSNERIGFKLNITNSGGSLFLRDRMGKLVIWKNYYQ